MAADTDYKKYGKVVKGESKDQASSRRAKFYTGQRKSAEATGDTDTTAKIASKLTGKKKEVAKASQQGAARKALGMDAKEAAGRNAGAAPGGMKSKLASVIPSLALGGLGGAAAKAGGMAAKAGEGAAKSAIGKLIPSAGDLGKTAAAPARKAIAGGGRKMLALSGGKGTETARKTTKGFIAPRGRVSYADSASKGVGTRSIIGTKAGAKAATGGSTRYKSTIKPGQKGQRPAAESPKTPSTSKKSSGSGAATKMMMKKTAAKKKAAKAAGD